MVAHGPNDRPNPTLGWLLVAIFVVCAAIEVYALTGGWSYWSRNADLNSPPFATTGAAAAK